jgi:hypothetical protein
MSSGTWKRHVDSALKADSVPAIMSFPETNIDAGADFGGDVILAEVFAGTVKLATRER